MRAKAAHEGAGPEGAAAKAAYQILEGARAEAAVAAAKYLEGPLMKFICKHLRQSSDIDPDQALAWRVEGQFIWRGATPIDNEQALSVFPNKEYGNHARWPWLLKATGKLDNLGEEVWTGTLSIKHSHALWVALKTISQVQTQAQPPPQLQPGPPMPATLAPPGPKKQTVIRGPPRDSTWRLRRD